MQRADEILNKATLTGTQQTGQTELSELDKTLINKLFETLKTIFPAWRQAFKTQKEVDLAKQQWVLGFQESGINDWAIVEHGLRKARQSDTDFLPSVGKFISWCKEYQLHQIGLESPVIAYKRLSDWSALTDRERCPTKLSPVLWWIYQQIGRHSWMNMSERDQKRAFREHYEAAKAMAETGEHFPAPEPLTQAEQIEHQPADEQTAAQALKGMKSILK